MRVVFKSGPLCSRLHVNGFYIWFHCVLAVDCEWFLHAVYLQFASGF